SAGLRSVVRGRAAAVPGVGGGDRQGHRAVPVAARLATVEARAGLGETRRAGDDARVSLLRLPEPRGDRASRGGRAVRTPDRAGLRLPRADLPGALCGPGGRRAARLPLSRLPRPALLPLTAAACVCGGARLR